MLQSQEAGIGSFAPLDHEQSNKRAAAVGGGMFGPSPSSRCWCFRTRPRKIYCCVFTIMLLAALGVTSWIVAKVVALKMLELPPAFVRLHCQQHRATE